VGAANQSIYRTSGETDEKQHPSVGNNPEIRRTGLQCDLPQQTGVHMPRIRLVKPTLAHESAIRAYLDAVHAAGLPLHGAVLEQFPDIASWIAFCDAPGGTLMPNGVAKVADSTYLAWDDTAAQMRGIINIRHTQIWRQGRKFIIGNFWSGVGNHAQKCRLTSVREANQTDVGQ